MVMGYDDLEPPKKAKDYQPEEVVPQPTPGLGGVDSNITVQPKGESVVTSKFGIPWKSILGFVSVFIAQLIARATVEGVPVIPDNASGILSLLGGSFVAAAIIWLKSNTYTVGQAEEKLDTAVKRASA